ncbi:hypothetical protein BDZ91DRAFT_543935 [Kalaharituber pfeilii]|nr:hypothetical protein BDZ91DRAFT_543935 [Kalaharituber pfeilii]
MKAITLTALLLSTFNLVAGHARLREPKPLGYGSTPALTGNGYNGPLNYDGSDFPCKGLIDVVDMTPVAKWEAGNKAMFEIQPNDAGPGVEGHLAAHSGGSCQISLSYDNGKSFKVLHSYIGGCPRDTPLNSNIAGKNQTFTFDVPKEAKAGKVIAAWSWIARTGNRGEFYMNCASVTITGTGTSTLDHLPNMWVGDLIKGDIKEGMCKTKAGVNFDFPFPGDNVTRNSEESAGPTGPGPNGGFEVCRAPGPGGKPDPIPTPVDPPAVTRTSTSVPTPPVTVTPTPVPTGRPGDGRPFDVVVEGVTYECRLKK